MTLRLIIDISFVTAAANVTGPISSVRVNTGESTELAPSGDIGNIYRR